VPLELEQLRAALPGLRIAWFQVTASTMIEAARLAADDAADIVVAEQQTAGQGRLGRSWYSEPETGLYVTLILRPKLKPEDAPLLTLALGLATAEAIARTAGLACDLRWPNDVLLADKKCAGILVEVAGGAFLAGVGINVNHERFPDELAVGATSLYLASGRRHCRERLLIELVRAAESFTRMLVEGGREPVLRMFDRASSFARGRRVRVEVGEGLLEGVTDGLDPSGFLWLRRPDGARQLLRAGGVRPLEYTDNAAGSGRRQH